MVINALFYSSTATIPSTLNSESPVANPTGPVDFTQLGSWHLLGLSPTIVDTNDGTSTSPPTDIKLRGVFFLGSQHQAHAIIETSDQTQKAYRINDQLPNGGILQAIDNEKITLLINNQQTTLPLSKYEFSQEAAGPAPAPTE